MKVIVATIRVDDADARSNLLLELWRYINLMHVCAYVLGDKAGETYTFEGFLEPVAASFGPHDGKDKAGMLTAKELRSLKAWEGKAQPNRRVYNAVTFSLLHYKKAPFCVNVSRLRPSAKASSSYLKTQEI